MDTRIVLKTFGSRHEAEAARALLAGSGIDSFLAGDDCGALDPALGFGRGIQLLVADEDVERAEEVIAAVVREPARTGVVRFATRRSRSALDRYTPAARRALFTSRQNAFVDGSPAIETHHLLSAILTADDPRLATLLAHAHIASAELKHLVPARMAHRSVGADKPREIPFSEELRAVLATAADEAESSHTAIDTGHLILALIEEELTVERAEAFRRTLRAPA